MNDAGEGPSREARLDSQAAALAQRAMAHPASLSVVLLGSAARHEVAWGTVDGREEPFSDLELLLVTRRRLGAAEQRPLREDLDRLAASFGYANPLFHVELLCRERRSLARMPPYLFTFELIANGRTLAGLPQLDGVRRVGLDNLDRRNSHEILMKRLWALAAALPIAWLTQESLPQLSALVLAATLARQPLDVATVLLPEAGILRPTYRQRLEAWERFPNLPFRASLDGAVGGDSAAYLASCLDRRRNLQALPEPLVEYERVVHVLASALGWLAGCPPPELAAQLPQRSRQLFHEGPVTRGEWLALLRQITQIAAHRGLRRAAQWLLAPRKGLLAAGLLELHRALIAHKRGQSEVAESHLHAAARALAVIDDSGWLAGGLRPSSAGVPPPASRQQPGGFPERWLALRAALGWQFWRTVRLGDPTVWTQLARSIEWPTSGQALPSAPQGT